MYGELRKSWLVALAGGPLCLAAPSPAVAQWTPQMRVSEPDTTFDAQPQIQFDSLGRAWVIWIGVPIQGSSGEPMYTYWGGTGWTAEARVTVEVSQGKNTRPDFCLASGDTAWIVWASEPEFQDTDILFSNGVGGSWANPLPVNEPNNREDYAPKVSYGGDALWVAWYGGPDAGPYGVFARRWMGTAWGPEKEVSASLPGYQWFVDLAVDTLGAAHVVWNDLAGSVYYSHSDGDSTWTPPFILNPPLFGIVAADWAAPSLTIGADGNLHVAWSGAAGGSGAWDIYYSHFDGQLWTNPVRVHDEDELYDLWPDLTVDSQGQVWLTWQKDESTQKAIYVAHSVANGWSSAERLDDGAYVVNETPSITLDRHEQPWIVWDAIADQNPGIDVVYRRYDPSVPVLLSNLSIRSDPDVALTWSAEPDAFSFFAVERDSEGEFQEVGRVSAHPSPTYEWREDALPDGEYSYRVVGWSRSGEPSTLGPVYVVVKSAAALRLVPTAPLQRGGMSLTVYAPREETATATAFDAEGRRIWSREVHLARGTTDLTFPVPHAGVYWVRLRTASGEAKTRVVILPR